MNNRNYSLDALRAIMMLLGIVVHAVATYTSLGVFPRPIKDPDTSIAYDFLVLFIHSFRMPAFFVLSGFFTALLYYKKGLKKTLSNRVNRIVFPFIASMLLVAPVVKMLVMYYAKNMAWSQIFESVKNLSIYINIKTGHLWFLYYLSIIYAICHLLKIARPKVIVQLYQYTKNIVFGNKQSAYKTILLFTGISACFILPQQQGLIDTSMGFMPDPLLLGTYFTYFIFGYILFSYNESLGSVFSNWKIHLSLAIILTIPYFYTFVYALNNATYMILASLFCSLLSWLMIFGLFGLFMQKLHQESKALSLISKSSYWIYIMHLPITILLAGIFIDYSMPHYAKCILIIIITYITLIAAYKLFVEHTFIGHFLNGKK